MATIQFWLSVTLRLTESAALLFTWFARNYVCNVRVTFRKTSTYVLPVIHNSLVPATTLNHYMKAIMPPTMHHLIHKHDHNNQRADVHFNICNYIRRGVLF